MKMLRLTINLKVNLSCNYCKWGYNIVYNMLYADPVHSHKFSHAWACDAMDDSFVRNAIRLLNKF